MNNGTPLIFAETCAQTHKTSKSEFYPGEGGFSLMGDGR
jgi:hypothetical protein